MKLMEIKNEEAYKLINHGPTVIVTTFDGQGKHNAATIAWTSPLDMAPAKFIAVISKEHKTFANLDKTKECVINIPSYKNKELVLALGAKSGFTADKLKNVKTSPSSNVKPARIDSCIAFIEAKFLKAESNVEADLLVFEVVSAFVREDAVRGNGKNFMLDVEKYPTLHHLGGKNFAVCDRII